MDLAERLRRLGYTPSAGRAPTPRPAFAVPIEDVVRGEWRETSQGRCFVARSAYPLQHRHGGVALGDVFALRGASLALLGRSPDFAQTDFRRLAFIDTETTGLAGGTGTYAFLVGVGYCEGDLFRVDQFFMLDHGEEPALLAGLGEALARFSGLVSFNGKTFDWPLLQTRFAMCRRSVPLTDPLHLDIMFPARRLWRERLGSCALSSLEAGVLGVRRAADVPSWLVPSIYFEYVRSRNARPLRQVFAHNEQDILSLVALTVTLARHIESPLSEARDPIDLYAVGRAYEAALAWEDCIVCYERALEGRLPARLRSEALCRLGLAYKRLRQSANAQQVWLSLIDRHDAATLLPYVELAKHLEHEARDYAAAIAVVQRALAALDRRPPTPWHAEGAERERRELQRRLLRLRRKAERCGRRA